MQAVGVFKCVIAFDLNNIPRGLGQLVIFSYIHRSKWTPIPAFPLPAARPWVKVFHLAQVCIDISSWPSSSSPPGSLSIFHNIYIFALSVTVVVWFCFTRVVPYRTRTVPYPRRCSCGPIPPFSHPPIAPSPDPPLTLETIRWRSFAFIWFSFLFLPPSLPSRSCAFSCTCTCTHSWQSWSWC